MPLIRLSDDDGVAIVDDAGAELLAEETIGMARGAPVLRRNGVAVPSHQTSFVSLIDDNGELIVDDDGAAITGEVLPGYAIQAARRRFSSVTIKPLG